MSYGIISKPEFLVFKVILENFTKQISIFTERKIKMQFNCYLPYGQ